MSHNKFRKSIWLPATLAVYCAAITGYFGPRLIAEGQNAKLWISVAVEAVVIVGLFFALRRKEKLASKWKD